MVVVVVVVVDVLYCIDLCSAMLRYYKCIHNTYDNDG